MCRPKVRLEGVRLEREERGISESSYIGVFSSDVRFRRHLKLYHHSYVLGDTYNRDWSSLKIQCFGRAIFNFKMEKLFKTLHIINTRYIAQERQ